jgi:hypothetical protein
MEQMNLIPKIMIGVDGPKIMDNFCCWSCFRQRLVSREMVSVFLADQCELSDDQWVDYPFLVFCSGLACHSFGPRLVLDVCCRVWLVSFRLVTLCFTFVNE